MTTDPGPASPAPRLRALPVYEATGARFTDPNGPVAGVTSILSGSKDTRGIDLWRESVGEARADEIRDFAAWRGTRLHNNVERFLNTGQAPPFHFVDDAYWKSIRPFLSLVDTTLLQEGMLWHPDGFAGTCDKQPNKSKLYDYTLQVAAYVAAANHVYAKQGLLIEQAAIACSVRAQRASITWLDAKALKQLYRHFLARLQRHTHARRQRRRN